MPPTKKTEPKKLTLAETLTQLRAGKNPEPISIADKLEKVEGLTTGNLLLDAVTGIGGMPKGRIIELTGPPSSGKTTCALQTAAKLQQVGGNIAFLDFEHALDPDYCQQLGIDTSADSFIVINPFNFEHGANLYRKLLATGELSLGIFDSVAAMVTQAEEAADTGKAEVMQRAKLMHQLCRQIAGPLHRLGSSAIFLNHVMDKADLSPMGQRMAMQGIKQKTSPGGKALPFYASLRMEFQQIGKATDKEAHALSGEDELITTSVKTKVTVLKNKVGDPFRTAELRVRFGKGFSQPHAVLSYLVAQKVIKATTGVYKYPSELAPPIDVSKGESKQLTALESNPEWLAVLEAKAVEVLAQKGVEKVDGSAYDKFGVLIDENSTEMSLAESEEFEQEDDEEPDEDISALLGVAAGNKVNMTTGEIQ